MKPDVVLFFISMMILSGFALYIAYLFMSTGFGGKDYQPKRCPPGTCVTDFITGIKTCPTGGTGISLIYDQTKSVCNSQFACDNPMTPFAIQADGSTNNNGLCEPGIACRCAQTAQCADYIVSVFTANNGNPYTNFSGQRLSFPQTSSYIPSSGNPVSEPPLRIPNPNLSFCTVSIPWLSLSNPGCNFNNPFTPSYSDVLTCMGMGSGCGGPVGNPCQQGTLAFIGEAQNINLSTYGNTLIGCVAGKSCPCGQVAIYDQGYGGVLCRTLT